MPPNTQELIPPIIDIQSTAEHSSNTNTQEQEELSEGEHIQNEYDGGRNTTRPGTQPELAAEGADEATIREYIEKQGKEDVPKLGSLLKR